MCDLRLACGHFYFLLKDYAHIEHADLESCCEKQPDFKYLISWLKKWGVKSYPEKHERAEAMGKNTAWLFLCDNPALYGPQLLQLSNTFWIWKKFSLLTTALPNGVRQKRVYTEIKQDPIPTCSYQQAAFAAASTRNVSLSHTASARGPASLLYLNAVATTVNEHRADQGPIHYPTHCTRNTRDAHKQCPWLRLHNYTQPFT